MQHPKFFDWLQDQYAQASSQRAESLRLMTVSQGDDFQEAAANFQLYNQQADEVHFAIRLLARYTADGGSL